MTPGRRTPDDRAAPLRGGMGPNRWGRFVVRAVPSLVNHHFSAAC